jgi:hypothetical protein
MLELRFTADKRTHQRQKNTIQGKLSDVTFDLYNKLQEMFGVIYEHQPQQRSVTNKILMSPCVNVYRTFRLPLRRLYLDILQYPLVFKE